MTATLSRRGVLAAAAANALPLPNASAAYSRFERPGPFAVKVLSGLSFELGAQNKRLPVRLSYPDLGGASPRAPLPLVVFSHGVWSSKDEYSRVTDHWSSHGFVVVAPTHIDSKSIGFIPGSIDRTGLVTSRVGDIKFLLDNLDQVLAAAPALAGRVETRTVAMAGHSFGSTITLLFGGLPMKRPDGSVVNMGDRRIGSLVVVGAVGPTPDFADDWSVVKLPVFAAAGTNDPGSPGDGTRYPWRWHLGAYDLMGGEHRYGVSIALGDHTFGGAIGSSQPPEKPDLEGLTIFTATSTAFLAGFAGDDRAARNFLDAADLPPLTHQRGFLERAQRPPRRSTRA